MLRYFQDLEELILYVFNFLSFGFTAQYTNFRHGCTLFLLLLNVMPLQLQSACCCLGV